MVACGYLALRAWLSLRRPRLAEFVIRRRLAVMGCLLLLIVGIKVFEDVIGKESGAVDELLLLFVHREVPAPWVPFFAALTWSGSGYVLMPAAGVAAAALAFFKRRFEALLVVASLACGMAAVWAIKSLVGRVRPALWDTAWYWGSSFPSGHTTNTAAFSTALALCCARIWPRSAPWAFALAALWTGGVGLSRMVLGVHWPSDVLAAICLGALIPLMIGMGMEIVKARRDLAAASGSAPLR
jgi:undecaprenyl-diphosphatase